MFYFSSLLIAFNTMAQVIFTPIFTSNRKFSFAEKAFFAILGPSLITYGFFMLTKESFDLMSDDQKMTLSLLVIGSGLGIIQSGTQPYLFHSISSEIAEIRGLRRVKLVSETVGALLPSILLIVFIPIGEYS